MTAARVCIVVLALCCGRPAFAEDGIELAQRLTTTSRTDVERAVADIERAPTTTPYLEQALREAARACEDVLADPTRALALYERILVEFPDGFAASIARPKVRVLRARLGDGQYAAEASELAALSASDLASDEIVRRADVLAARSWPGAPTAALVLAARLERDGRLVEAQRRYAAIEQRWPRTPQALAARRGGVEVALTAHDWTRAAALARDLPTATQAERALHGSALDRIARGRQFDWWGRAAWVLLIGGVFALLVSLAEAGARAGWQGRAFKPGFEIYFLLPLGGVLVGVALTAHATIAPVVCTLSIAGIVLAWLSGSTLELLRVSRRAVGARAALNGILCILVIAALACIALTHNDLLETVIETVQFGPE
jgi:hypothetical protein